MSSRCSFAHLSAGALLALSTSLPACAVLRSLAGKNTIDLEGADVRAMSADIRKSEKTICPRERVQMGVFLDVVLKGEQTVSKLETWAGGPDVNRNGKLDFADFAFHSAQGQFDEHGWFTPKRDLLATVDKELELKTVLKRRPDKFSLTTSYKPDYRCIREAGSNGEPGSSGATGESGAPGASGNIGGSTSAGGNGADGRPGGPGANGGQGAAGPRLTAYATFVKTAFYERLIAVRIEGSFSDFLLAHPEGPLVLTARGGAGGSGGSGGRGGDGGTGGSGNPAGNGGTGAQGGNGGSGGNGGPGGSIELVIDERFPELAKLIRLDAAGGPAGAPGSGGGGGRGGSAGSGMNNAPMGAAGNAGAMGANGAGGSSGPSGTTSSRPGKLDDKLSGLPGVTVL